jgi:signal transduction histidine kinase/ligand-binding sensor domain-containing protein/DNA-binding NarL/FixJ family response regulator
MRSPVFRIWLLLLCGFCWTIPANAQAPSLSFRHIGYEQGLSNSTIESIFQDTRGYIWVATRDGLNRYDGNEMRVFRNISGDTLSLSDNYVRCLTEDRNHILWIGTSNGLNRFDPVTQTFKRFLGRPAVSPGGSGVNVLYLDRQGHLWVGMDGEGLFRMKDDGWGFDPYPVKDSTIGYKVYSIAQTNKTGLWVGTEKGISYLDMDSHSSVTFPLPSVLVIQPDLSGDLWLGTAEDGLRVFHPDEGLRTAFTGRFIFPADAPGKPGSGLGRIISVYRHSDKDPGSLDGNMVKSICLDRQGNIWVGCINGGLNLFIPSKGDFEHYRNDPMDPSSLSQRTVSALFEDIQGNLWVGTHRGGLNLYMVDALKFRKYPSWSASPRRQSTGRPRSQPVSGLTSRDVRAFYEDANGLVWIGTDGGGLNVWDPAKNAWSSYKNNPDDPSSLSADAVLDINKDSRDRWWIATWEGGLNQFHPQTGSFTRYLNNPTHPGSISSSYVQKTLEDKKGRIWVATYFGGLNLFDPDKGTFTRVSGDSSGETKVSGNNMVSLGQDTHGNIWVGTDDGGLNRLDIHTERWSHYFTHEGRSPDIRVIFTDHSGRLWIGLSGLYLYDPAKDTFKLFTQEAGLDHEFIKGMAEDGQGNFWISTGGGLTSFNPDTKEFHRYNEGDGLQGLEFEAGAYLQTSKGELFFGGTNGFNAFYPRDIQRNPYIPPVYITGIQVFDQKMAVRDTLDLNYKQSTFSFTFTALNYTVPENNQYAYMLEGFDNDWQYVGNTHRAVYTNLDPGTYTFRVKASNNDGVWNEKGAWVRIVISPPFWKKGWFFALVALFIFGSGAAYLRFKRNLELAKLEEKKREEIHQVQLQFFTNISHELRTPLTLILGQSERLLHSEGPVSLQHYYSSIHRNAGRLMGLINELMDFRKLETGSMALHVMPGHLSLFLEEIAEEFADWATEKNIRFILHTNPGPGASDTTWFDRQILEKIVLNLLHNAFKYTDKGGSITLELLDTIDGFTPSFTNELILKNEIRASNYRYIRVADTGIGISKESIAHLFERYYRISETHLGSGVGLAFVRSLTQLHKGDILVYSERHKGTEILVGIPYGEANYTEAEKWIPGARAGMVQLESLRDAGPPATAAMPGSPPTSATLGAGGMAGASATLGTGGMAGAGATLGAGGMAGAGATLGASGLAGAGASGLASAELDVHGKVPLILIVEDNEELRYFLADSFKAEYQVRTARDGQEAWDLTRELYPDLIISDVMMPGINGVEYCRLVKQDLATSHIPFVMLTAKDTSLAKMEGVESGADYYFTKPLSIELLLATVRNVFSRQRKLKEHFTQDYRAEARELVHSQKDKEFMDSLLKVIDSQLINPDLDVDYLCAEMGMSRTKLYQKIKQISGQSIGEFVRTIRLKKAVQIMLHEDVPFTEVMYRIGIQSQSYFTKAFKKEFGKTPTQFLQDIRH